jgi:hypothetical protein
MRDETLFDGGILVIGNFAFVLLVDSCVVADTGSFDSAFIVIRFAVRVSVIGGHARPACPEQLHGSMKGAMTASRQLVITNRALTDVNTLINAPTRRSVQVSEAFPARIPTSVFLVDDDTQSIILVLRAEGIVRLGADENSWAFALPRKRVLQLRPC